MNYNQIGNNYNATRKADPFLAQMLYDLVHTPGPGTYLDIGCGTGNYTSKLAEKGLDIIGIDPSERMLSEALNRSPKGQWKKGSAENIPLPDSSMKAGIASLTLHHWQDLSSGFTELNRVIDQGPLVIFTSFPAQMEGYWLHHYFPQMMQRSMVDMPSEATIMESIATANWQLKRKVPYSIREDLQDCFLYIGKHHPRRYLDPAIRNGISSFRMEGLEAEVQGGLLALEQDIQSGKIAEIQARYAHDDGDYCFLVLEK